MMMMMMTMMMMPVMMIMKQPNLNLAGYHINFAIKKSTKYLKMKLKVYLPLLRTEYRKKERMIQSTQGFGIFCTQDNTDLMIS